MRISRTLGAAMAAVALGLGACATDNAPRRDVVEFTDDAALNARVKTAIATDSGLGNAANINVNTYRGVVQLGGFVDSSENIERAANAARSVPGVRSVENNLRVRPSS